MKIERLGERVQVQVSDRHRFGTDALLLADFASPKSDDKVLDVGTGCGIIPLYLDAVSPGIHVLGVDIQLDAVAQFAEGIRLSASENLKGLCVDIKSFALPPGERPYDLIISNPPYKVMGTGIESSDESDLIARFESKLTFSALCAAAKKLLRFGGRFCVCHRPERLTGLLFDMREHGLEPKRMRFVHQRETSEPFLVLIEGRAGGNRDGLRVFPPLFMEGEGGFSPEVLRIYRKEKNR